MDKLTESLTSVSPGPHHNHRLGGRVVFHVIRDCLCFCPLGNKEEEAFSRTWRQTCFTREFYSITCKIISRMVIFSLKCPFNKFTSDWFRVGFHCWHFGNYGLDLASPSPKTFPSPPLPLVPLNWVSLSLFTCPDIDEDTQHTTL